MASAIRQAPFPVATAPLNGFDVPWGSEVVIEGVLEAGKREFEGPFGEFTGHYSGGRKLPVMRIDKVAYRTVPIFEHLSTSAARRARERPNLLSGGLCV